MTLRLGTKRNSSEMKNTLRKLQNQDMQKARGMDTLALIPVFAALYELAVLTVLP